MSLIRFGFFVLLLLIITAGFFAGSAEAQQIICVPKDHPTIQKAIDVARDGDTVLVAPGTYHENLNFCKKALVVQSERGAGLTTIDGGQKDSVVVIDSCPSHHLRLDGFTIRNGRAWAGGGISIKNCAPRIENNIITRNASCAGAGICASGSGPIIKNNVISANYGAIATPVRGSGISLGSNTFTSFRAEITDNLITGNFADNGGGVFVDSASGILSRNVIVGNIANDRIGGIGIFNFSDIEIDHNLIAANWAGYEYAAISYGVPSGNTYPRITHNTIVDNFSQDGIAVYGSGYQDRAVFVGNIISSTAAGATGFYCKSSSIPPKPPIVEFNNIYTPNGEPYGGACPNLTGVYGNLAMKPDFVNPASGVYLLRSTSACVDAGDPARQPTGLDLSGMPVWLDGHLDFKRVVDIGAFEYSVMRLEVRGEPTPGKTLDIRTSGRSGLRALIFAGFRPAEIDFPPFGAVLFDWLEPWVLLFDGVTPVLLELPIPSNISTPFPVILQGVGIEPSGKVGNVSNRIVLTIQ